MHNFDSELLVGGGQVVLELLLLLLQHGVTVQHHLLEPHPLLVQVLAQVEYLEANAGDAKWQ